MDIDVGQIIAGKYELVRLIGKGAMGQVWLATHNSLGGEFAIKLVEPADDVEAETAAGRFQFEAQIAAKLSRKTRHIVSVSDHGEEDGLAYLVMELLEGESLEMRTKRVGALEMPEVAAIVLQVARALSLAHEEGVFHRDLKPANVWLSRDEDGRLLVKLLDFGIARSMKPMRTRSPFMTSKDMVLGTPSYMSPEQARGLDSLDYRCDLWALAVVAYEALTKRIPFEGETVEDIFLSICTFRVVPIRTRRPELPPAIDGFFARAFASKVEDRFATALELTEAFEALVDPAEIENALGIVLTPSARRLVAATPSQPGLVAATPSQPGLVAATAPLPGPSSQPGLVAAAPPSAPTPGQAFRSSSPDLNVTLGDPTLITRRSPNGLIIALVAIIGALGIGGVIFLVAFRGSASAAKQPEPTSSAVVTATTAMQPIVPDVPPASPSTPTSSPTPSATPAPLGKTAAPPVAATASPPAASTTPPPIVTPPPGRPTPRPAKSTDRSGVF